MRCCTTAGFKLTKLFGIDDFLVAKDFGKVFIIIIYCFCNYYYYYCYCYYYSDGMYPFILKRFTFSKFALFSLFTFLVGSDRRSSFYH